MGLLMMNSYYGTINDGLKLWNNQWLTHIMGQLMMNLHYGTINDELTIWDN